MAGKTEHVPPIFCECVWFFFWFFVLFFSSLAVKCLSIFFFFCSRPIAFFQLVLGLSNEVISIRVTSKMQVSNPLPLCVYLPVWTHADSCGRLYGARKHCESVDESWCIAKHNQRGEYWNMSPPLCLSQAGKAHA